MVNKKGPIFLHGNAWSHAEEPTLQKFNELGYKVLPHPLYFTWPLANQLPLLQASWQPFAGKMFPQPAGGRKYFSRVHWILKHRFLCYRNKQTFFDGKNVLIVMVPILIDKDVFEPGYNDLKFTVQNCSYFCTNLILNYRSYSKFTSFSPNVLFFSVSRS